jgi:hypothetical protein
MARLYGKLEFAGTVLAVLVHVSHLKGVPPLGDVHT